MQKIRKTEIDQVIRDNFSFIVHDWRAGIAFLLLFMVFLAMSLTVSSSINWQNSVLSHSMLINQMMSVSTPQSLSRLDIGVIFIISFLIIIYAVELLVLTKDKKSTPFIDSFKNYPAFLLDSIIFVILIFIFMFALVIPSIFLFVKMIFYPQELLIKRRNPIAALSASYEFTDGKFWSVFGLIAGIALIAAAFSILFALIAPYSIVAVEILDSLLSAFILVFLIGALTDYFITEQRNVR